MLFRSVAKNVFIIVEEGILSSQLYAAGLHRVLELLDESCIQDRFAKCWVACSMTSENINHGHLAIGDRSLIEVGAIDR